MRGEPLVRMLALGLLVVMMTGGLTAGMGGASAVDGDGAGVTERVSVGNRGVEGIWDSDSAAVSAGGRFVAFSSSAPNLVAGDTNRTTDVFVRDRRRGVTRRVSVSSDGVQADGESDGLLAVSPDGRFVAFQSTASNLVPGDTNETIDVFVRDRWRGVTRRVSVRSDGTQFLGFSSSPAISANGRFVAFDSFDPLPPEPGDEPLRSDVFVRDRWRGVTRRVSVTLDGTVSTASSGSPAISADGRFVAFTSQASNLVPGDTNGYGDIFVRDRRRGVTRRVSVSSDGTPGDGSSNTPEMSAGGRFVAFTSEASNLVPGDTHGYGDIFVRDRRHGMTRRASVSSDGVQGDAASVAPEISPDGRFVAFPSSASNLVPGDTNESRDVFLHH